MTSTPADELAASRQRRLDSRLSPPDAPRISLQYELPELADRHWDGLAGGLFPGQPLACETGLWRVLGGPGTGKTALLIDIAVAHVAHGGSLDSIQFLTHSKESAASIREELLARIGQLGQFRGVGSQPIVRSVHSYAFGLLARDNVLRGGTENEIALITGAEQDAVIRELLRGHAEDAAAAAQWPEELRGALPLVGFAREVRDLLLRVIERGQTATELADLGQQFNRPQWIAVAQFLAEYEQVQALAGSTKLSASELVSRAVDALRRNAELLREERQRLQLLLIDDAEHLDPRSAQIVSLLAEGVTRTIVTGDRDQAVLHFRGADDSYLNQVGGPERDIVLRRSFRMPEKLADVAARAASTLPGKPPERAPRGAGTSAHASAEVQVFQTHRAHFAAVADVLRRARLEDGIAWSDMAILVRSMADTQGLHRALLAYDVPVYLDPTDIVLAEQRIVAALLLVCDLVVDLADGQYLPPDVWEQVLTSRFAKADPVIMRRLRRSLRRYAIRNGWEQSADQLISALVTETSLSAELEDIIAELGPREAESVLHARRMIQNGLAAIPEGVEATLWAIWQSAGIDEELRTASLRGGADGAQADRGLDAMLTLFDAAGDFVEDRPYAGMRSFLQFIREQELPTGARDRRGAKPEAVQLMSAHSALGQQWRVVVVAGVQEGTWPQLGASGTLLDQQEFVEWIDHGIEPGTPISRVAEQLAEERRLFHVAVSRSTEKLLVTAVDTVETGGDLAPSRFLEGLNLLVERVGEDGIPIGLPEEEGSGEVPAASPPPRVLAADALVTELRLAVCDPQLPLRQREQAAAQLARLAAAGVYGAAPEQWWGVLPQSTVEPLWTAQSRQVRLSPSKVESLLDCQLKWMLQDVATRTETTEQMSRGQLFHLLAEYLEKGVSEEVLTEALCETLPLISEQPLWKTGPDLQEWLDAWQKWRATANSEPRELVGVEVDVDVALGTTVDKVPVVLHGVIDRLTKERGDQTLFVTDLKTGKSQPSKAEVQQHAQLSAYQVAVALGEVVSTGDGGLQLQTAPAEVRMNIQTVATGDPEDEIPLTAGALLAYPRLGAKTSLREQRAFTATDILQWESTILDLAEKTRGPQVQATVGSHCDHCNFKTSCPAQPTGKATTR